MKTHTRGKWWRAMLVMAPLAALVILALAAGSPLTASAAEDGYGDVIRPIDNPASFGIENDMLFIANGRASNVAVIDVAKMSIVDYIPVPRSPINAFAAAGQTYTTLKQTLAGLGMSVPYAVHDMYYWEIHGVVPSADRSKVYAIGALAMTDSNWTMYEIDTKTHATLRKIPMAISYVGYCGLEYDRNDENSGVLYAENMAVGPGGHAGMGGLPLKITDPLSGLLPSLGLGDLVLDVEDNLSVVIGGLSEQNISSGANTDYISTDWNANLSSSTCGIAWNKEGTRAYASQMFEPLVDTIDWGSKRPDGEILPPAEYIGSEFHQATSAKERGLLIVAWGTHGIAFYDMNLEAAVGHFGLGEIGAVATNVHGVEVSPVNENILYVTADNVPSGGTYVVDITDIDSPVLLGGMDKVDLAACGTYAISDKQNYYSVTGRCEKPDMTHDATATFWETYTDYQNRELSVRFNVSVNGNPDANNVMITGANNTNGVTTSTAMPVMIGDLSPQKGASTVVKYHVPTGVSTFSTELTATAEDPCGTSYTYPSSSTIGTP